MYQVGGLCLKYTVFGVVLMTLHYFVSILSSLNLKINELYSIHLINFFLSFICAFILLLILPKMKNKIGFIFIGLSTVKFLFIIVFIVITPHDFADVDDDDDDKKKNGKNNTAEGDVDEDFASDDD